MLRLLFRVPTVLYRLRCGWLLGHRFLLLCHVGRRSGLSRRTMLEVIEYRRESAEAVVLSALGRRSDWLLNIQAGGATEVIIASSRFAAAYRFLDTDEAAAVLLGYQRRNRAVAPLIRFFFSKLVGWHYDGSPEHARRLVAQLPAIAFRPLRKCRRGDHADIGKHEASG